MHNQQGHHLEALNLCTTIYNQQYTLHAANASLYTLPYKQNQLNYMHQSFLNAPLNMLIEAALSNQLMGIPFIKNPNFIRIYLAPSSATTKGKMKKPKSGIRSTRKKLRSGRATKLVMKISDSESEKEKKKLPQCQLQSSYKMTN